jgi:hypothetical protein
MWQDDDALVKKVLEGADHYLSHGSIHTEWVTETSVRTVGNPPRFCKRASLAWPQIADSYIKVQIPLNVPTLAIHTMCTVFYCTAVEGSIITVIMLSLISACCKHTEITAHIVKHLRVA